jgi:hypothetical protein
MSWEARASELSTDSPLIFQTLDWHCEDIDTLTPDGRSFPVYKIFAFGVDINGAAVTVCINGFSPFFFIEVPSTWDRTCVYTLKEALNIRSIKSLEF